MQAAVIDHPMVLSGAFPEDLVRAVGMPFRFPSNNSTYEVEEANLLVLCGVKLEMNRDAEDLEIVIDCTDFAIAPTLQSQS